MTNDDKEASINSGLKAYSQFITLSAKNFLETE
jgi:hypothetical protein